MNSERTIIHSDLNSFYASAEIALDKSLRGKALAVCGNENERHGIVLAKSEEAKKFGIKTGMPNWQAKKLCRDLIIIPPHFNEYYSFSKKVKNIYLEYSDRVEPFGIDECWLDLTNISGNPKTISNEIRIRIKEELSLTVSIGLSFNKVFAKLGSDLKKPDALTIIDENNFKDLIWPLPVSNLLFVGSKTEKKLKSYCIDTIGALAKTYPEFLKSRFGINGEKLYLYANGLDNSEVTSFNELPAPKSISRGITLPRDIQNEDETWKTICRLSEEIAHELRLIGFGAEGIGISIKFNNFTSIAHNHKLNFRTQNGLEIAQSALEIWKTSENHFKNIRSITVSCFNLKDISSPEQLFLFTPPLHEKRKIIDKLIVDRFYKDTSSINHISCIGHLA